MCVETLLFDARQDAERGLRARFPRGGCAAHRPAAPRMHPPFDQAWFTGLLAARAAAPPARAGDVLQAIPAAAPAAGAVERDQDWGEAPDVHGFVDRAEELATFRGWELGERCRLVA